MKQLILLAVAFLATAALYAQTTLEEYNYIVKGYQIQVENGLDMKKGYQFTDLNDVSVGSGGTIRTMNVKALYRSGETTPCAIMIIYHRPNINPPVYVCVPHYKSSSEIWKMCYDHITADFFGADNDALLYGLARISSFFAQNN